MHWPTLGSRRATLANLGKPVQPWAALSIISQASHNSTIFWAMPCNFEVWNSLANLGNSGQPEQLCTSYGQLWASLANSEQCHGDDCQKLCWCDHPSHLSVRSLHMAVITLLSKGHNVVEDVTSQPTPGSASMNRWCQCDSDARASLCKVRPRHPSYSHILH